MFECEVYFFVGFYCGFCVALILWIFYEVKRIEDSLKPIKQLEKKLKGES